VPKTSFEITSLTGSDVHHLHHNWKLIALYFEHNMTFIPIASQRIGKQIPSTNALNSKTSIARQRGCIHAL
jgi:hypothetical protein